MPGSTHSRRALRMKQVLICPNCSTQHTPSLDLLGCACGFQLSGIEITYVDDEPLTSSIQAPEQQSANTNEVAKTTTCSECGSSFSAQDYAYCPYCAPPAEVKTSKPTACLEWPWGEEKIPDKLTVGREPPATAALAARLETQYPNVSRQHAELFWQTSTLMIQDLGSTNGTYVNGQRITVRQPVALCHGNKVKFASTLEVTIHIE